MRATDSRRSPAVSRWARRGLVVAALAVALHAPPALAGPPAQSRPVRVLLLYQQQAETQPMQEFTAGLRETLARALGPRVEFYQEALDFDRFTGRESSSPLASYFAEKYGGFGIDVVVPVGTRALRFAVDRLGSILPRVPVVFALCAAPQIVPSELREHVTGRLADATRFGPTIAMARALQPDAERIVVIGGAGRADSASVAAVMSGAAVAGGALPVSLLQGLPLDVLFSRLRVLPRRSIVIFANYRLDAGGQVFEPSDVVGSVAHASSAPVYAQLRSYVGEGVVGGSVTRFADEGILTGRLLLRVLRRRAGERMPSVESIANAYVADWRQLRRWGLPETRLPPNTELLYREPDLWARYRSLVLLVVGVMSAELLLIGRLLAERRDRIRAQRLAEDEHREVEETRRQVAHMGRVALVGELAATIAHDLRQPLAAIRANAQAGVRLTTRVVGEFSAEELQLCREIFADIVRDDEQAADILARVGTLLRNGPVPTKPVDLNETCRTAARLLEHDARARGVRLSLLLDAKLPTVSGDAVELEQVVLNLALNALDASQSSPAPHVVVRTNGVDDNVEVAVHDNGPGLAPDVAPHLFESFFTTKPQGLGLGLVIVRSIVERHHGRVHAENREGGGAVFRVVMSRTRSVDADAPRQHSGSERPIRVSVRAG